VNSTVNSSTGANLPASRIVEPTGSTLEMRWTKVWEEIVPISPIVATMTTGPTRITLR